VEGALRPHYPPPPHWQLTIRRSKTPAVKSEIRPELDQVGPLKHHPLDPWKRTTGGRLPIGMRGRLRRNPHWRMSGHPAVQQALRNGYFDSPGLPRLHVSSA
jgi:hypothetical protein